MSVYRENPPCRASGRVGIGLRADPWNGMPFENLRVLSESKENPFPTEP